jgi:hypothetical protein
MPGKYQGRGGLSKGGWEMIQSTGLLGILLMRRQRAIHDLPIWAKLPCIRGISMLRDGWG